MKLIVTRCAAIALLWASLGALRAAEPRQAIHWQSDLEQAVATARATKKPLMIQLTASWCGYCSKMKRDTFRDTKVIAEVNKCFVPVIVDADQHPDVLEILKVDGLPTTVVVLTETKEVSRIAGYRTARQLRKDLKPFCK